MIHILFRLYPHQICVVHVEADAEVLKKQLVGDVKVKFGIKDSSKTQYQFITNDGATPLYGLHPLRYKRCFQ